MATIDHQVRLSHCCCNEHHKNATSRMWEMLWNEVKFSYEMTHKIFSLYKPPPFLNEIISFIHQS
jgi:hypothetical protein